MDAFDKKMVDLMTTAYEGEKVKLLAKQERLKKEEEEYKKKRMEAEKNEAFSKMNGTKGKDRSGLAAGGPGGALPGLGF